MTKDNEKYQAYVQILNEELIPAMGCTEPIALAYAAAKAREVLGCLPDRVCIGASGSIIKNVKSVIVPNTNHLKGIPAAAAAGIVAGNAEKELEVISVNTLNLAPLTSEGVTNLFKNLKADKEAIEMQKIEENANEQGRILREAEETFGEAIQESILTESALA